MRILLPHIQGEIGAFSFYSDFHSGIDRALRELGHQAVSFPFRDMEGSDPAEQQALYRLLVRQPCDAVFDLCCWGHCLSRGSVWDGSGGGEPLYDSQDMAYVGLLFDHPWYQPLPAVHSTRLFATVGDVANLAQLPLIYPQLPLRGTAFVPPAIDAASSAPDVRRDIDLLYVGNVHPTAMDRNWRGARYPSICNAVADLAIERPAAALHALVEEVLLGLGQPLQAHLVLEVLQKVEYYRRHYFRLVAVRAAAASGASMLVVGEGWDEVSLPGNVSRHGLVDYRGMRAFAARSRLCLDASTYLEGVNDRVFNYMVNGAVCLTNSRGFLETQVAANAGLCFYRLDGERELAASIRDLLAQPQRLAERSQMARQASLAAQTWRHRVETILGMLSA